MPELPDVEAIIRGIKGEIVGRAIKGASILDGELIARSKLRPAFGKRIEKLSRRGKYILFTLSSSYFLIFHMRMTGGLFINRAKDEINKYTRLILHLDGVKELRFVDQRRLGKLYIARNQDFQAIHGLHHIGPEPLSSGFTPEVLKSRLKRRSGSIKSLLMNQRFIAGIGNIYGDEILFQSRIRPARGAGSLTDKDIGQLHKAIRHVLVKACEHNADLSGMRRWFVQGRMEGYCINCKNELERVRIGGRYSYFCVRCQR